MAESGQKILVSVPGSSIIKGYADIFPFLLETFTSTFTSPLFDYHYRLIAHLHYRRRREELYPNKRTRRWIVRNSMVVRLALSHTSRSYAFGDAMRSRIKAGMGGETARGFEDDEESLGEWMGSSQNSGGTSSESLRHIKGGYRLTLYSHYAGYPTTQQLYHYTTLISRRHLATFISSLNPWKAICTSSPNHEKDDHSQPDSSLAASIKSRED